jgi:predicted metal-dependent HD superfamily phosphohydrolase
MLHRWLEFTASIAPRGDARTLWIMLDALYSGGDRPYHSLAHIEECLARLDAWREFVRCQPELEFALWLHDAVYQPGSAANEEQSADVAAVFARECGLSQAFQGRVRELILLTQHGPAVPRGDDALMVDIDMAVLASTADRYDCYAAAVRSEYRSVSDVDWRNGRGAFLRGLLARARIFHSVPGVELEREARTNVRRELVALGFSPEG